MFRSKRFAFLAIGGLGLLAAVAPGLAATLQVPLASDVPAAGQNVVAVQGFKVTEIDWTVDDGTANVVQVRFFIERDAGALVETEGMAQNAQVRVRLLDDPTAVDAADRGAEWAACAVEAGSALCDTSDPSATMAAADLVSVDIIAFDSTGGS